MNKRLEQFPFYIRYWDVNEYYFWLIDEYGKDSKCVKLINEANFKDKRNNPQKYKIDADALLFEIRQYLIDNGCEEEVKACDEAFSKKRKKREANCSYIPMHKRWEMDDDNDLQIMKQLCKGKTILCRSCGAGFYKASETNEFKCTKCGSVFEVTPDSTVK